MSRNIVITGANRGIGLALVQQYVAISDSVFAICRNSSVELNSISGVTIIEGIDVTKDLDLRQLRETLGDIDIDILINNAGTNFPEHFTKVKKKNMEYMVKLNTISTFHVAQLCAIKMLKTINRKKIANINSIAMPL